MRVIASLIFVGLELRQQQQIALSDQYQNRLTVGMEYFRGMAEVPIWQQRTVERLRRQYDVTKLSPDDRDLLENGKEADIAAWFAMAQINLLIVDNLYYQYESGFTDADAWESQRQRLKWQLSTNSFARHELEEFGFRFRQSFVELGKQLIEEIDAESAN